MRGLDNAIPIPKNDISMLQDIGPGASSLRVHIAVWQRYAQCAWCTTSQGWGDLERDTLLPRTMARI